MTKKGKGYAPAESNPGNYHGVSRFDPTGIPDPEVAPAESFSSAFGRTLSAAGNTDKTLCAITAAMIYGTGLQFFSHAHPERFFDVGMAEQHAVTFAAGLASKGMLPVVCIYSTFLQRSYDQIIHDVNLLHENVVFAVDRAGFVPEDGETHQGIYDPAFLSQTGMPIYSPSNYEELRHWLPVLLSHEMQGPRAIRYPRGGESKALAKYGCSGKEYDKLIFAPGAKTALVSYADEVEDVLAAAEMLAKEGIPCDVYKLVRIFPFEEELIHDLSEEELLSRRSDGRRVKACGGIGEHLARALQDAGWQGPVHPPCREGFRFASRDSASNQTGDWSGCRTSGRGCAGSRPERRENTLKIRLDQYLVQHGMIQSRERAKALIMAGVVFVNEQKVDKAGEMIKEDAKVEVRGHDIGYVSRGGLKLEKAMQCFPLTPNGKVCMDIGASTGGFTDCMLQNGAVKVYAVDVGYGQLAWSLRTDERVVNMERTNIRNVTLDMLAEPIEFFSWA